jgi:predicted DCC family thiol-disulfide oxidoreductase YuxK
MGFDEFRVSTSHPPAHRPLLIWDGECGVCRKVIDRLAHRVGEHVDAAPYQEVAARFPDIPEPLFARALHLIEPDGTVHVGARAVYRALAHGGHPAAAWCHAHVPGVAAASDIAYRLIARHRPWFARIVRWFVGPDLLPRQYRLTRWLYLRALGITALCAFVSMAVQAGGLFGAGGISPAADFMERVRQVPDQQGWSAIERVLQVPTLLWLSASDGFLWTLIAAGIVLAVLLIADVLPGLAVLGLWLAYLSLVTAGGVFFHYQWDILLIESLLVSLFLAPWRLRPRLRSDAEPARAGVWLVRLLACKLMLLSGLVKLRSGDATWAELGALQYHFFTQPIPTWTSWYAHHAPAWLLAMATLLMLGIELVLPWFVLGPRRPRMLFGLGTIFLMAGIGATGNYGFFNLLSCALAIMLFDDTALRRLVPARLRSRVPDPAVPAPRQPRRRTAWIAWGLAFPVLGLSALVAYQRVQPRSDLGRSLTRPIAPLMAINSYGLFAVMTTTRPEIELEGSRDGVTWTAYDFRWKADRLDERPRFAGPHMPRLDWQMWFAALGDCRTEPWLHAFLQRLLEGAPAVRGLLARDPFAGEPPRYLRTTLYLYTFTNPGTNPVANPSPDPGQPGWWQRERVDAYCPTVTLERGQLVAVPSLPATPEPPATPDPGDR